MYKVKVAANKTIRTIRNCETYQDAYYTCTEAMIREDEDLYYSCSTKYLLSGFSNDRLFPFGSTKAKVGKKIFLIEQH